MPALMFGAARGKGEESYCICPSSPCVESESSVCVTRRMARLELHSATIMMMPAVSRMDMLAGTFSFSAVISMPVSPVSRAMP